MIQTIPVWDHRCREAQEEAGDEAPSKLKRPSIVSLSRWDERAQHEVEREACEERVYAGGPHHGRGLVALS